MGRSVAASPAFARSTASAKAVKVTELRFAERSRPDPAELLHVGSDPQRIADVDGERPNAAVPESATISRSRASVPCCSNRSRRWTVRTRAFARRTAERTGGVW